MQLLAAGDFAASFAQLLPLVDAGVGQPAGLAAARVASGLRQLDEHAAAVAFDERAVAAGGPARVDGLIGRAADSVGAADADTARHWLEQVAPRTWRDRIRHAWVDCEIALLTGDAAAAVTAATRAHDTAGRGTSPRHRIKSALFRAAALRSGEPDRAIALLRPALADAVRLRLDPLTWPLVLVLGAAATGADSAQAGAAVARIAAALPPGHGRRWRERPDIVALSTDFRVP